ncbi:MAG: phospholipid/cholesterol/gamma-HCH transport system substrate-binding protein [Variibacter sp.]|jgi:phospholipid/cholesterol/gamma-HCH transport system substrate-binding protein|nr:phospholipid/cholesterol/gamma-HCH transport system substrate-binding protein [Variibacter sp.]
METRARYVLVGLFTLAVMLAGFGFVYWLHNTAGVGEGTSIRVRFEGSVSGLRVGSAVLFNGLRVGDVTAISLDPTKPREVIGVIAVHKDTPVRPDTKVSLEFAGLTGGASLALTAGSAGAGPAPAPGQTIELVADAASSQDMTQSAREVLRRIDAILSENAAGLRTTIDGLGTFTSALARNSNRVDNILEGLEKMTSPAAAKPPAPRYDIQAPHDFPPLGSEPKSQLVVVEPTTLLALDTQMLVVKPAGHPPIADAQWADSIPKLIQAKVIQSFENAKILRGVSRPLDGLSADYQLMLEVRSFHIVAESQPTAEVEIAARILGSGGKIVDARIFRATAPAALDVPAAVQGMSNAFGQVAVELVTWAAKAI